MRAEAGLADDFQPVVSVVCVGGSMTITVATQQVILSSHWSPDLNTDP